MSDAPTYGFESTGDGWFTILVQRDDPSQDPSQDPSAIDIRSNGMEVISDFNQENTRKILRDASKDARCSESQAKAIKAALSRRAPPGKNSQEELATKVAQHWAKIRTEEQTGLNAAAEAALDVLSRAGIRLPNLELQRLAQASAKYKVNELPEKSQLDIYARVIQLESSRHT